MNEKYIISESISRNISSKLHGPILPGTPDISYLSFLLAECRIESYFPPIEIMIEELLLDIPI